MSDEEGLRGEAGSELSSIPNLISSTSSLSLSEQSGPLSLTLSSEQSEATTSTLQEPNLDYDDEIELTQVRPLRGKNIYPQFAIYSGKTSRGGRRQQFR